MTTITADTGTTTPPTQSIAHQAYRRYRNAAPIKADDPQAQEKLAARIKLLTDTRNAMKAVNAAFKLKAVVTGNEKLRGFGLTDEQIAAMRGEAGPAFKPWELQNLGQNITHLERRLEDIRAEAERAPAEDIEGDGYRVVENTDLGRIQMIFDGKPDEATRRILKRNGFRWAPSQDAWQRHLNANGRNAVRHVRYALRKAAEAEA